MTKVEIRTKKTWSTLVLWRLLSQGAEPRTLPPPHPSKSGADFLPPCTSFPLYLWVDSQEAAGRCLAQHSGLKAVGQHRSQVQLASLQHQPLSQCRQWKGIPGTRRWALGLVRSLLVLPESFGRLTDSAETKKEKAGAWPSPSLLHRRASMQGPGESSHRSCLA